MIKESYSIEWKKHLTIPFGGLIKYVNKVENLNFEDSNLAHKINLRLMGLIGYHTIFSLPISFGIVKGLEKILQ